MPGLVAIHDPFARADLLSRFTPMCQHPPSARPIQHDTYHSLDGTLGLGRSDLKLFNPAPPPTRIHNGRYTLMMQGELVDCASHRQALAARGIRVGGGSHADVLLATMLAEGMQGVARLNGSYFFIFWDEDAKRLIAGSDRHASRPHYYHLHDDRLYLAHSVQAILDARGSVPAPGLPGITTFLAMEHPFGDLTFFEDILAFPGGTFLERCGQTTTWHPYWRPHFSGPQEHRPRSQAGWLEEATHLIRQSIRRATSDQPFTLPLSGGSDSRMVAAFAARGDYQAFTFGNAASADVRYAQQVARVLGCEHTVYALTPDYLSRHAEELITLGEGMVSLFHAHDLDILDHLTGMPPVLVYGMTAEVFRTEVMEFVLATRPQGGWDRLRLFAQHVLTGHRPQARFVDEAAFIQHLIGYYWSAVTPALARQVLAPDVYATMQATLVQAFCAFFAGVEGACAIDRLSAFNIGLRQRRFSQAGVKLANGVAEYRKPFDDNDLVDFMLSLPPATRRRVQSAVLAHAAPALAALPRTGTDLPMTAAYWRRGFAFAGKELRRWLRPDRQQAFANPQMLLRGPSRAFYEGVLLDPQTLQSGFFNPDGLGRLVQDHMAGRVNAASALCAIATVACWHNSLAQAAKRPDHRVA